jgi:sugar phosphate isomerase/epimerase
MFAISTYCLHREPLPRALEMLSEITGSVEVMDDGLHYISSPEILESYSLSYSLHAPSRGVNIASLLEPIRRASVQVTDECFAIAAEVGASVVIHPGYFAWVEEREKALDQLFRSLDEIRAAAAERGVAFSVENMGNWDYFFLRTPAELSLFEGVGFTLDVGHAHLNACLPEFLDMRFDHIHLHDNDGTTDSHGAVGAGTIDFTAVTAAVIREGVTPVIEVETLDGVLSSIRALGF